VPDVRQLGVQEPMIASTSTSSPGPTVTRISSRRVPGVQVLALALSATARGAVAVTSFVRKQLQQVSAINEAFRRDGMM
jgi:hypothetical protein